VSIVPLRGKTNSIALAREPQFNVEPVPEDASVLRVQRAL
jgi:hypothetical protein